MDRRRLEDLRVPLPGGKGTVPLGSVADVRLEEGPINITRYDRIPKTAPPAKRNDSG